MVTHDNIHIPSESFPHWIWFVIEFSIVLAVAVVIAWQLSPAFQGMVLSQPLECLQKSHLTICSLAEQASPDENTLNWIFWSIVAGIFFGWYIVIRTIILKKPILESRG